MLLIIILTLQLLLIIMSLIMLRITRYRLIWYVTTITSSIMVIRSIIILYYNGHIPLDKNLSAFINTIIPIIVLVLIVIIFLIFYSMYRNRINLEQTLRQKEKSANEDLITRSAAVEQSQSVVIITDLAGNIEYVNPKFTELTGYEKDEVIGQNPRFFKSDYLPGKTYEDMWNTISDGKEWKGEFHNKKKNGELYWEAASISSIKDTDGNIKYYLALTEDITEKKSIEEALYRSERRLKDVQKVAQIGTWERDEISNQAYWSDENYRILGLEPGEIEPSLDYFKSVIHPEDKERVLKAADNSRAVHKENSEIFRLILKDGTVKYVNDWSYYTYNSDGKHTYSTGLMQDITLKVEQKEELKTSLKEKNALLRELYHRTKNNMQVISAMLNLSASKLNNEAVLEIFTDLDNRIQSMALVHEKLYQSQNLSSINLKEYIMDLCSSLELSYNRINCKVIFIYNLEEISVLIDAAVPLGLIINELVSNSFKHAFPGRAEGKICISSCLLSDSRIKLEIKDNGIGMGSGFNLDNLETIGLQTVYAIGNNQLHGNIELDTSSGFKFSLEFNNDKFISRV